MFLEHLVDWAHAGLQSSDEGRLFLQGRGSSEEQWSRHRIGFIHGEFDPDPKDDPGHSDSCFIKEKKHLRCDTCRFRMWATDWSADDDSRQVCGRIRNSVVLPLTSYSGALVGIQTRSIVEKDYDNFVVSRHPEGFAFGLSTAVHHIWNTRTATLVEGPFDQQVVERLVTPGVIGLTTSAVGRTLMTFLKRFATRIYWVGDLDQAGRDGLKSLREWHANDFDIVDVNYPRIQPKDKDPGDFWKRVGDKKFAEHFRKVLL